jgi:hypothetical protein
MILIDRRTGGTGYHPQTRALRRPGVTTTILLMIAIMIVMDVFRRRRVPAEHLSST